MFLRGKPVKPTVSIPVDNNGIITVLDISTDLIIQYVNGFKPDTSSDYLSIDVDEYGLFVLDGKQLQHNHSRNSRTGRLLKLLFDHRGEFLKYKDIIQGASLNNQELFDKAYNDLISDLRKSGYRLVCERIRTESLRFSGIVHHSSIGT
ncbi:hypothetical protein EOM33_00020 [Candidatus Saccharibacteria bacterium]|nr:hypothetical protein [Candidatus Saccharibacteria bacterium]